MAAITRDEVKSREAEVRRMNEEADRLEAETRAARERAADATRESQNIGKQWQRIEADAVRAAGSELIRLSKLADAVLAEKPDNEPVMHETRFYARSLLAGYVLGDGKIPTLADPLWGSLHGLQGRVVAFMATLGDSELYSAADALECRLHRACLARLRVLAGVVE